MQLIEDSLASLNGPSNSSETRHIWVEKVGLDDVDIVNDFHIHCCFIRRLNQNVLHRVKVICKPSLDVCVLNLEGLDAYFRLF